MNAVGLSLAQYVRDLRESLGWSQVRLSQESGVPQPTISDIERGSNFWPGADYRRRLAKALGVRHVDIIVAAGELTPDEIAPLPETHISDPLLRDVVAVWDDLGPVVKQALRLFVNEVESQRTDDPRQRATA